MGWGKESIQEHFDKLDFAKTKRFCSDQKDTIYEKGQATD